MSKIKNVFCHISEKSTFRDMAIDNRTKKADAKRLMAIMSMGVKKGHTVTVTVEGDNEEADFETVEKFFKENL